MARRPRWLSVLAPAVGCEGGPPAPVPPPVPRAVQQRPAQVLVLGGGLTGSLTAQLLREEALRGGLDIGITVWEKSTYPAGRFGARRFVGGGWVDLGAQVLSCIEPTDHDNSMVDGHGMRASDLQSGWELVKSLEEMGSLERVRREQLAATEERMQYEGLWAHFVAPGGFASVLRQLLRSAGAELHFSTEASNISRQADGLWRVTSKVTLPAEGSSSSSNSSSSSCMAEGAAGGDFQAQRTVLAEMQVAQVDAVVLAVEAFEAVRLAKPFLPDPVFCALDQTAYNRRTVVALAFAQGVEEIFMGGRLEVDLEDVEPELELLSYQSARRPFEGQVVVAHTRELVSVETAVDLAVATLARLAGKPQAVLREQLVGFQGIRWHQAQLVRPVEAVTQPEQLSKDACLDLGGLVIAGDFLTSSSFTGCHATAAAATRAVLDHLRRE